MFPDPLFVLYNLGPEVCATPGIVTSHIQIEPVDMGQQGNRENTSRVRQDWETEEKRVDTAPRLALEMFHQVRS